MEIFNFDWSNLSIAIVSGLTLAGLGTIDTLLTSVVADNLTKTKHNGNRELIGQGLGNFITALFGGIPGAGSTTGTVANINSNGTTNLSGIFKGCKISDCKLIGGETAEMPGIYNNDKFDLAGFSVGIVSKKKILDKRNVKKDDIISFSDLLTMVAEISNDLRIRFSTSHPKDITLDVLKVINKYENVCNYIHLPAQSGNSRILKKMNRTYDRNWYLNKIKDIKTLIGDECAISSDFITGFCSETEKEHNDTLSLMDNVIYDYSYMFYYSERPGTLAERKYKDDIPLKTKKRRLSEIIEKQNSHSLKRNSLSVDNTYKVLVEGESKKSKDYLRGRTSENKTVIFPKNGNLIGNYIDVKIKDFNSATLFGEKC